MFSTFLKLYYYFYVLCCMHHTFQNKILKAVRVYIHMHMYKCVCVCVYVFYEGKQQKFLVGKCQ